MNVTVQLPKESPQKPEDRLDLLLDWEGLGLRPKRAFSLEVSLGLHVIGVAILLLLPESWYAPPPPLRNFTRIVAPLYVPKIQTELTQRAQNKDTPSKSFELENLIPRPKLQLPRQMAASPGGPTAARPGIPEPPRIEVAEAQPRPIMPSPVPGMPIPPPKAPDAAATQSTQGSQSPDPQPPSQEKPKLAFENPYNQPAAGMPGGVGRLAVPNTSVKEALRVVASSAARGPSGGLVVGDAIGSVGGFGEALHLPPSPGKSSLELLSDPQGVDFQPYLIKILASVRRNWFSVMPESVKLGSRGKVSIQFAIDRSGRVPKLVIAVPSGADALDRAAVAGISASNPFPPLPGGFRGDQIRLQFTFSYNVPSR